MRLFLLLIGKHEPRHPVGVAGGRNEEFLWMLMSTLTTDMTCQLIRILYDMYAEL